MSTTASGSSTAAELVPISDRLRYLQVFRIVLAATVGLAAWVERDSLTTDALAIAIVTGAYLLGSLVVHGIWRVARRAGLAAFGLMLIADGVYLAWATWA